MKTITIITDWKKADYYMAVMRGVLLSGGEDIHIAELTHQVETYKTEQAAFILRSSFAYYPAGTIHIVGVRSEPENGGRYLAAKWQEQYFLFSDNGFATLFWQDGLPEDLYELSGYDESSFPEADILAKAALRVLDEGGLTTFSKFSGELFPKTPPLPWFEENVIIGTVVHSDSFGNAITNISREYFSKHTTGKKFVINPGNSFYPIREISSHYRDVSQSDQLAIFNCSGMLEIAIRNGSARELLGLKEGTNIRIEII